MGREQDLVFSEIVWTQLRWALCAGSLNLDRGGSRAPSERFRFFEANPHRFQRAVYPKQHGGKFFGGDLDQLVLAKSEQRTDFVSHARVVDGFDDAAGSAGRCQIDRELQIQSHDLLAPTFEGAHTHDAFHFERFDEYAIHCRCS